MATNNTSKLTIINFIWRFLERCGAQGVTFIVSIVLARLLDPAVYGVTALVAVFTNILSVFIDSGMSTALVQKKDADDLDFSSIFWFNIVMCIVLYLLMFFAAPFIAAFYNQPELVPLIRVISLTLIISGVKGIQCAYVSRHMIFKRFFFATLGGTVGAAFVGIFLAWKGFGVWALVAQSLFNNTVDTMILWITVKWRPKFIFSFKRLVSLFSFGWKLLVSSLLDTVYTKLHQLIIGKVYTSADLAFYNRGDVFPSIITENINSSINSVLLPVMSKEQDDKTSVKRMTRRAIVTSTYIMMPMMMGLAVCAEPIVRLILTDKWLPCVFFLRIFCFTFAFYPIHTANLNAIKAMGRSDIFLKLEIIKKIIGLTAIVSTMLISVKAMALSLLVTSVLSQIINAWPNKRLLDYSYLEQIKDMLPQIILSSVMGLIVYCVQFLKLGSFVTFCIQVPVGVIVYIAGSVLFRLDSFDYILSTIHGFKNKKQSETGENV